MPDGADDPALIGTRDESAASALAAFKTALAGHRSFARETHPPAV